MSYNDTFPNPYDPQSQDYQPETLPLDEIIRQAIAGAMIAVRVCLPAKITKVSGNQKVNVQPLLQVRYTADNSVETMPEIPNVMVSMPMGQNYSIKLPIAVGDTGWLIFCDRSLDIWSVSPGGIVDPQDSRTHDVNDPIFIPGLVPFDLQTQDDTTDLVVTNGQGQIRVAQSGKFKIQNETQELINNLVNLVNTLKTASTVSGGPFTPDVVTALGEIATNLQSLQET